VGKLVKTLSKITDRKCQEQKNREDIPEMVQTYGAFLFTDKCAKSR